MSEPHPFEQRQSLQDYFRTMMHTVTGQALEAAGYTLCDEPMKWISGKFRYTRTLADGTTAEIIYQVLVYNQTQWTGRQPSRFRVSLRRDGANPLDRTLSALVVEDFGVSILPSADHWWTFNDTDSLSKALLEAGHLIVGYGIPWLAGDLQPDDGA